MIRKWVALLLAALLALGGAGALAESWVCAVCGAENAGNFCGDCGAAKPAPAGWVCAICGAENAGNFCGECGAAKPAPAGWVCAVCGAENAGNFCSECGAAKPAAGWVCAACGAENAGNFCAECGAAKPDPAAAESPAFVSPAGGIDERLDAAFAAGRAAFAPGTVTMPDPATCELAVPEEFWQMAGADPLPEATLRQMLASGEFTPVSISPDGTHVAGMLSISGGAVPVAVSPNRVAILCPTSRRGVADTYGNMAKTYNTMFMQAERTMNMGKEGMSWSPDGRYFCSLNIMTALMKMQFALCNPIIADTETGEMFLLDTFDHNVMKDGGGILTGCFSRDGHGFYALYYGARYEARCVPVYYDLETCEAQVCGAGPEFNGYPMLAQLRDGSLLTICDEVKRDKPQSLAKITPGGNTTFARMPANVGAWYTKYTGYSEASGWLVIKGVFANGSLFQMGGFQRLSPDDSLTEGMDTVWMVSAQTRTMVPVEMAALKALVDQGSQEQAEAFAEDYLYIDDVKLSPDGRYAAVLAGKGQEPCVLIVRMEDMAALPAEGIDLSALAVLPGSNDAGIYWSEAGLLVKGRKGIALWSPVE